MSDSNLLDQHVGVSTNEIGTERIAVVRAPLDLPGTLNAELSVVELAVSSGLVAGLSNIEIADQRNCSVHTIENQVQAIYAKLGVRSRAELLVLIHRHRIQST